MQSIVSGMARFAWAARPGSRNTIWLLGLVGFLGAITPLLRWHPNPFYFVDQYETSSSCKWGELTLPNGRGLVANVRRTACAPDFAPDDINYYVFVHRADEPDDNANLVFQSNPDNHGPFPVITPRVFWSDAASLHIAFSSSVAVSSPFSEHDVLRERAALGRVRVVYDNANSESSATLAGIPMHLRGTHLLIVPVWSRLHSGMKIHLGDDPVDGPGLTLCPNIDMYNYVHITIYGPYNSDATIGTSRCIRAELGALAIVRAVIPSTIRDWYYPAPLVRVSLHNGRSGVTSALGLQPDVPVGSVLTMTRKEFPVTLDRCEGVCADNPGALGDRLEMPGTVRVRLLRYDPVHGDLESLYVQVLTGRYAGRKGWMELSDMQSADSLYSNSYGLDYSPVPELVLNSDQRK